ncbi:MAG: SDR family NAD(P)-dependent oxidoreductase [Acidimicrobiales bacterium]|nr:SDR family NAD(P)-dependent oxidoreductase [Acidimicrobiales bacterium]
MSQRLAGLTTIVTGASSGIGEGVAARFVTEGATVFAAARSEVTIDGITWVPTDVADPVSVNALVANAVSASGRLDAIVNNAGVQVEKPIEHTTDADFDRIMDVNVRGVFNCCRAAVRQMAAQTGGGSIINIGSVAGNLADHGMAVYNASKGAVHSLTRAVATDNGHQGVRCNAISPGWIMTALADAAFDLADDPAAARSAAIRKHPVGRMGTPDDIAGLAVYLASPEAAFVSGSCFTIDGGLTAQSPINPN